MGSPEEEAANAEAPTLSEAKDALRWRMRALRRALDPAWAERAGAAACAAAAALPPVHEAASVALYRSLPGEVPIAGLEAALRRAGKRILLPAWDAQGNAYRWAPWGEGVPLSPGPLGIPQPPLPAGDSRSPDAVIVPGLAFDAAGRRIGRGGGHYDRLLAGTPRAARIGLAFAFQCVARVPAGPHDEAVDWIVTEESASPARKEADDARHAS